MDSAKSPKVTKPLGQRKLVAAGIPARAAQGIAKLSKDGGWVLTIERARELSLLSPAERIHRSASYVGIAPTVTTDSTSQAPIPKKPLAIKLVFDHPSTQSNTDGCFEQQPVGRPLAEEIRAVSVEVARAYSAYQTQLALTNPDDQEDVSRLQRKQDDWLRLTRASASLSASLKDSEQLGDTRSLASIVSALSEAAALIRADIDSIPDRLSSEMSSSNGILPQAASAVRDLSRTIVDRALTSMTRRFSELTIVS